MQVLKVKEDVSSERRGQIMKSPCLVRFMHEPHPLMFMLD